MEWILPGRRVSSKARGPRTLAGLVVALAAGCLDTTVPGRPEPCDSLYCVDLPIAAEDTAFNAYGLWPFGVHGGSHAVDGHPGWDIEYRAGASARAVDP